MDGKKFNLFGHNPTPEEAKQALTDAFASFAVARRVMTMSECSEFLARWADDTTMPLGLGGRGFVQSFAEVIEHGLKIRAANSQPKT